MGKIVSRITGTLVVAVALLFGGHGAPVHHRHSRRHAPHHVVARRAHQAVLDPHDEWAAMVKHLSDRWQA